MTSLNDIAKLADTLGRGEFSKKACWQAIKTRIEAGETLTPEDLAILYRHFLPKVPANPKTVIDWVGLALPKHSEIRPHLNYIYSDGSRLMATDGHRLHLLKTSEYKPGFYDSGMALIHEPDAMNFPQIDRIIPDKLPNSVHKKQLETVNLEGNNGKAPQKGYKMGETYVDAGYLDQAMSGFESPMIRYSGSWDAIKIYDVTKIAVVMPVRQ